MSKTVQQGFRLSPQQQHVWWAQGAEPSAFVVQARIDVTGTLDRRRLAQALERIVERHEILRTTFPRLPGLDVPVQSVESTAGLDWSERSLAGAEGTDRESALDRLRREIRETPFDLANGPLLRATLVELQPERHALLLCQPALAADGASLDLLAAEIARAYQGRSAEGEVFQYADLAELLHDWQGSPAEEEPGAAFWRRQDLAPLVGTALGGAGLPGAHAFRPDQVTRRIGRATAEKAEEAAGRLAVPLPLLLLAAWHATLHLSTGEEEILFGVLFDGRTCAELETALGLFARYLPLSARSTADSTLAELARSFSTPWAEIAQHQDFYSSEPVERLLAEHGAAGWPFGFDHRRFPDLPGEPGGLAWAIRDAEQDLDRFELRLSLLEDGASLTARLVHDPQLVRAGEAERLLERYLRVLDGLLAGVPAGEIDVLTAAERRQILTFNQMSSQTSSPIPEGLCAHHLIEAQARARPHAIAVEHAGRTWTYAELDARANRLAGRLRTAGLGPGSLVGLRLGRSPALVEALLGVLKAGAAYLPLDPGDPAERLSFIARDAGISLLLTEEPWETAASGPDGPAPSLSAGPDDLAYVLYTSGSTGRPKGVMIPHRALVNYLVWARRAYAADRGTGAPVHSSAGFDLTVTSLLVPLAAGSTARLLDESDPVEALAAELRGAPGFSLVKLTPAHLDILRHTLRPEELAGSARVLVIGGEALLGESVAPWRGHAPETRLINEYGPTEATVGCCVYEIPPGLAGDAAAGPVPIGRPIANVRLHLTGRRGYPVPPGAPGEIRIGGDGLARGYLGAPGFTAERFVPDPFAPEAGTAGGRLYRTGDLARLRPDGHLEFLGRIDHQVKIRGVRIEPGEIEAALLALPGVREAAVVARSDRSVGSPGGQLLVAYLVGDASPDALRRLLAERLPDPMIPAAFVTLTAMPLTPLGKLDRRALAQMDAPDPAGLRAEYRPPRDEVEILLAGLWEELLGVERIGLDDHFFHLGGHSLLAVRLIARIEDELGVRLPVLSLFREPTIERLGALLDQAGSGGEPPVLVPLSPGEGLPWFLVHASGGDVFPYVPLARRLAGPVYGLRAFGLGDGAEPDGDVPAMAGRYLREIRAVRPRGPYLLAGWSMGGVVAYEMARQLREAGEEIAALVLIDSYNPAAGTDWTQSGPLDVLQAFARELGISPERFPLPAEELQALAPADLLPRVWEASRAAGLLPPELSLARLHRLYRVFERNVEALASYVPEPLPEQIPGRALLLRAADGGPEAGADLGWHRLLGDGLVIRKLPGTHHTLLSADQLPALAASLNDFLDAEGCPISGRVRTP